MVKSFPPWAPRNRFPPADRYPAYPGGEQIIAVHNRLRAGADISSATRPANDDITTDNMAMSNAMADRDETFNTRYGSYRGWQMAVERVKPIPRDLARLDLSGMVRNARLTTPEAVVDQHFLARRRHPIGPVTRQRIDGLCWRR